MDKVQYLVEANRQLSDEKYYALLPHTIKSEIQGMIRDSGRVV